MLSVPAAVLIAALVLRVAGAGEVDLPPWDYAHQSAWPGECNKDGRRQSPIDFRTVVPKPVTGNFDVKFHGDCELTSSVEGGIVATRHAFVVSDRKLQCKVDDPLTGQTHVVTELHFHRGAEHVLQSGKCDIELHVVTVSEKHPDKKLVLAVLYRVAPGEQGSADAVLRDLFRPGTTSSDVRGTRVFDFLPASGGKLYYYAGSLTTPPCSETVQWAVAGDAVPISARTLRSVNDMMVAKAGAPFTNNRRLQSVTSVHNVRLLNNGGYVSWALYTARYEMRRIVLFLCCFMVLGGIGLLLYYKRDVAPLEDGSVDEMAPVVPTRSAMRAHRAESEPMESVEDLVARSIESDPTKTKKVKHVSYGTL